jgi:hypothetical protein
MDSRIKEERVGLKAITMTSHLTINRITLKILDLKDRATSTKPIKFKTKE